MLITNNIKIILNGKYFEPDSFSIIYKKEKDHMVIQFIKDCTVSSATVLGFYTYKENQFNKNKETIEYTEISCRSGGINA